MITLDIRRWTVRHLLSASALYWAGLSAATLTPFARAVASIARLGGGRGSASASFNNDVLTISALKDGVSVYAGSAHLLDVALWISLPPLALWLVWLALRPSRADSPASLASRPYDALPDAARSGMSDGALSIRSPLPIDRHENRG